MIKESLLINEDTSMVILLEIKKVDLHLTCVYCIIKTVFVYYVRDTLHLCSEEIIWSLSRLIHLHRKRNFDYN